MILVMSLYIVSSVLEYHEAETLRAQRSSSSILYIAA